MTPLWAAEQLVDFFLPDLASTPNQLILEPSCGRGAFLHAIPRHVPALGVEIDPVLARHAARDTQRPVIVGDFRTVALPPVTAIIGNPPFDVRLFDQFLVRAWSLLPDGGRAGFLLSSSMAQTPSTILRWNQKWMIDVVMVPRTLFPRAIRPLIFMTLTKSLKRTMTGLLLYAQAHDVQSMSRTARSLLLGGKKPCWRQVVEFALCSLGGSGTLTLIYAQIEPRRPSGNPWWREKTRQMLQKHFTRRGRGQWSIF